MSLRRDAADDWCSKVVRARDGACVRCGNDQHTQACHIYGRRMKVLRWSLDNLVTGCPACHRRWTENPVEFHDFLDGYLGSGHMAILREKSQGHLKTTKALRKEVAAHYRAEFRRMEEDFDYEPVSYN